MREEWKPAYGFDGFYEISNRGQLRRVKPGPRTRPGLLNKPSTDKDGYQKYVLSCDNVRSYRFAHRLAFESFFGAIPEGQQIYHKNGDKRDNRLENLEAVTPSQNTLHGFRVLGRKPVLNPHQGSTNGRAKLSEAQAREVFKLRSLGWSQQRIADRFDVDQTSISRILLGKGWRHLLD